MKYNIKALRQKRATLRSSMEAILEKAKAEHREVSDEESQRFDGLKSELTTLNVDIDGAERELDRENSMDAVAVIDENSPAERYGRQAVRQTPRSARAVGRQYAQMFGAACMSANGFADLDDFLAAVHFGGQDPRLKELAHGGILRMNATAGAASSGVPSDGGFLVPTQFSAELLDASLEDEIVRPRANVYPMQSATRKIAGFNGLDHSSGTLFGGFKAVWLNEGTAGSLQKAKTRAIELIANKLALFTASSNELIADGISFADLIGSALRSAISWQLDYNFLNGTGAGQPLGVLNAPSLVVVPEDASQPASTITYSNIVNMFSRLHPRFVNSAVWVANSSAVPQLLQMQSIVKNVAGTENVGGSAVPVVTQQNGKFSLLTREIIFTEKLPALGSQGDILLASFDQYAVGIRKEISLDTSNAPGFLSDETNWRAIVRADGQDKWDKPFTPKNGNPQSWCVTLAARS